MNYANLILVYGAISSVAIPAGLGLDYYARHEFVTIGALLKSDINELKDKIRSLEYDKANGLATVKDLWQLDQYYSDLEKREAELNDF